MHDIDRTQLEFEYEGEGMGFDTESDGLDEIFNESSIGFYGNQEGPLDEVEEMELAAELLEVSSDEELDQFIGGLVKSAGKFVKSKTGRALGGVLKKVAKKALPVVGGLAGTALGTVVPGLGNAIGGVAGTALGNMASNLFELELEGLSPEDQEYEVARRYVRFASEAVKQAAKAPQSAPPDQVAKAAVIAAARKHAPGLLSSSGVSTDSSNGNGNKNMQMLGMLYIDGSGRLVLKRR
jgi:uncharacterized protein (DUF697 family)